MTGDVGYFRIRVYGLVQGVGFRPYIFELCSSMHLEGCVKNTGAMACIYVCGDEKKIGGLCSRLSCIKGNYIFLPGARIDIIEKEEITEEDFDRECDRKKRFYIAKSSEESDRIRFIPEDMGICQKCKKELSDPSDRRYRHPFISCVSCGPRFSIMEGLPYDRENTSMKDFPLCKSCSEEYQSKGRRRHAQTIACLDCGPWVQAYIRGKDGKTVKAACADEAVRLTEKYIREGKVAAVKNVGGYHFVFDALNAKAAEKVRIYKKRENKPFAVMFRDISSVEEYCLLSEKERQLLDSPARPIVLLQKKEGRQLAENICPKSSCIGAMLACDGIQVLLLQSGLPLVMTSANRGGEPIESSDERALMFLDEGAVDIVLLNDRRIINALDDSIYKVTDTGDRQLIQTIRRARGIVPGPITISKKLKEDSFAAGGDLKASFAYGRDDKVYLSGHFGDLEDERAVKKWREGRKSFEKLFDLKPVRSAADKHPAYISAKETGEDGTLYIQHHYAHILSVAAECHLSGKVLGAAFDGTGYGDDGTIWGGEFLYCDLEDPGKYRRLGHLIPVCFVGGDSIASDAEKAAMCFALEAERRDLLDALENPFAGSDKYKILSKALGSGINNHLSSSAGRLFDAASAIIGICRKNTYEGECPQLLQAEAEKEYKKNPKKRKGELKVPVLKKDGVFVADTVCLMAELMKMKKSGLEEGAMALEFHFAIADMIREMFELISRQTNERKVALGGGTFANSLLVKMLFASLEKKGFEVYINEKVPSGDGGLALGQIFALT